jgi:molybdopterin synthase sulfur carrier subunit
MAVVKVRIPTPLQSLTKGLEEVEASGATVIEVVQDLDTKYAGIADRISEKGKIRRFVNIYVNDEDVRFQKGELSELKDGDQISIVPAIAGGASCGISGGDTIGV